MSQIKLISKNIGIYTIINLIKAVIGFLLVPLYTFYLTPNDFGIVSVVSSLIGFFSIFYSLSLSSSVARFFHNFSSQPRKLIQFVSTIITFLLIFNFSLTLVLITFRDLFIIPFIKGIGFYPYIIIGLVIISITPIIVINQTIIQNTNNARKYSVISLVQYILNISLVLILVVKFRYGAFGVLLAQLISTFIFFIFSIISLFKLYKLEINKTLLKNSLNYSLPLIPHNLSGWTLDLIDRILLNNLRTTADVGVYNVGYKLGSMMDFLINSVHLTMSPWFMINIHNSENKGKFIYFTELIIYLYCFTALFLCFFSKEIFFLFVAQEYHSAEIILPYITFSYVLIGAYYFWGYPLFYDTNRTKLINIPTILSAITNVLLNLVLIPKFGVVGAALATFTSYFISSLITLYLSHKSNLINYKYVNIYGAIIISFLLSVFVSNLDIELSYHFFLFKFLLLFFIFLLLVKKYERLVLSGFLFLRSKFTTP